MNTVQETGTSAQPSLIERVPPFFPARLMTPAEVTVAVADGPTEVQKRTEGKWHLCGDVCNAAFAILSEATRWETAMRISGFRTPIGAAYGVVSHQVRGHAHRFLLPLYETRVVDLLTDLERGGDMGFLLGREGNSEALLIEPQSGGLRGFGPLLAMSEPLSLGKGAEVISELSEVIRAVSQPAQVPSLSKSEPVVSVDVSVLMPIGTLQRLLVAAREGA